MSTSIKASRESIKIKVTTYAIYKEIDYNQYLYKLIEK